MPPIRWITVACIAIIAAVPVTAQTNGKPWSGVLRDDHRRPIAGATVRVEANGNRATVATASDGSFTFAALEPGAYTVSVEYQGATATYAQPVQLPREASAVLELSAGGTLSVVDQAKTGEGSGGQTLSGKAVSDLPLNKRDFSALLLLAAGTMTDTNGSANFTQQFAINGQRGTAAVFGMDGVDSSDPEMGGATFTNFNVDAVEEIHSSSGWMPAEIGRGAAGYTDIVTRSGTNALHGSFFEFLRNASLDARNFFDRQSLAQPERIPPFIRNEFGLTNGGPVVIPGVYDGRNRTFYFAEYQGFRQILSDTEVISVPTARERQGLDSTAFAGDTLIVPVDPRIAKILARYPLPNDPSGPYGARTYEAPSRVVTDSDQLSIRLDHNLSDKSRLFGRFTMADVTGPTINPSQTIIDPQFAAGFLDWQRNAAISWIRTPSPTFTMESSVSFTRATPQFPTSDHTDAALTFGDGSYEPFNSAGGTVIGIFGNLFQVRQNFQWIRGKHTLKAGGEWRGNRDTTVFGINPNGGYQFGGGTAYATAPIVSTSGLHNIAAGQPLPDALSGLLEGDAFSFTQAVAPPIFSQGAAIGDSAIHRDAYNFYFQDTWKISSRLTINAGLRYEIESRIREATERTSAPVLGLNTGVMPGSEVLINPSPGYKLDPNGWGPRLSFDWGAASNTTVHVGGAITTLLINLYQDNSLTGSTPFVVYPHVTAAPGQPIDFGVLITPDQLPTVYNMSGAPVFASENSKQVPANTLMNLLLYEQQLAAVSPGHQITQFNMMGISPSFENGYIATWTAGIEQKIAGATINAGYVGTAGIKLQAMDYPNGFQGATAAYAPYSQFDSSGNFVGGYGLVSVIDNRSHSSYDALQISATRDLTASGFGFQSSYTFSKSIDDTSAVISAGISGQSGNAQPAPENPFDARLDKGPSNFDVKQALAFNVFQDLHADRTPLRRILGRTLTSGWQVLGIGTFQTGLPFTIYSGIQQTGLGSMGTDRPDQIGAPVLSTSRTVREDYFGLGANNTSYFSIPINVPGGTGPNHGVLGTLGRNTFRGPGLKDIDLALIKDTPLVERAGAARAFLQFRAEFFNIFNIVNFGLPASILLGPGFGEINHTASNSRQIQFSMKVIY